MRSAGAVEELAADAADTAALAGAEEEEELAADTAKTLALAGRFFAGPLVADTAAGRFRTRAVEGSCEDALAGRF